jgi:hypothetical protein
MSYYGYPYLKTDNTFNKEIIIFMSYYGYPYLKTDNTFNKEVTMSACQARVMSAYHS